MATTAQRNHLAALMDYMHAHAAQLDYPPGDQRGSRDGISWGLSEQQLEHVLGGGGRWQGDCSEYCSYLLKCAGLWHWSQPGYTGSHLQLLTQHYTNGKDALTGALIVFGPGTGHHEAMVRKPDPVKGNPLISSHGHSGLDVITLSSEAERQSQLGYPGVTFLSIAHL